MTYTKNSMIFFINKLYTVIFAPGGNSLKRYFSHLKRGKRRDYLEICTTEHSQDPLKNYRSLKWKTFSIQNDVEGESKSCRSPSRGSTLSTPPAVGMKTPTNKGSPASSRRGSRESQQATPTASPSVSRKGSVR